MRVNGGVPRASCFDAAACVLSEYSHGQAVGDGYGDAPELRCEEDYRTVKERASELVLAICEPGFATMVVAGQITHVLVNNLYSVPLSFFHYKFLDLQDSRCEGADRFIKGNFGFSGARGERFQHPSVDSFEGFHQTVLGFGRSL